MSLCYTNFNYLSRKITFIFSSTLCFWIQAGGFDKLLLDSLYEDEHARRQLQLQNAGYGHEEMTVQNPFDHYNQHDPFAMSQNIAPPTNVQMALLAQQQQMTFQQQQQQQQMTFQQQQQQQMIFPQQHHNMAMVPHQQQPHAQYPQQMMGAHNPFGDPLPVASYPHNSMPQQGNYNLM